jgi:Fe-S-cluster containining protein
MEIDWNKVKTGQLFLACLQEILECQQCGRCCRGMAGIALTRLDRIKMAKHLGLSEKEFTKKYTMSSPRKPSDRLYITVGEDKRCPFQGDHGGCTQYEGRGQVCRFYPFAAPEQMERAFKGQGMMIYDRCKGMMITYLHVLDDAEYMPPELADAMLKSESGKLLFLKVVDMEGRGEAYIKNRLKEFGLDDWPDAQAMKTMAYQYAVAYCTKFSPEARANIRRELNDFLNH